MTHPTAGLTACLTHRRCYPIHQVGVSWLHLAALARRIRIEDRHRLQVVADLQRGMQWLAGLEMVDHLLAASVARPSGNGSPSLT